MRFLARLIGWALFGLGVAELLWATAWIVIVAWNSGGYLAGPVGKVLSIVLLPLAPLLVLYQGIVFGEWQLAVRLLLVAPAVGAVLVAVGGFLTQIGKPRTRSKESMIHTPEEAEALAKSIRERLNGQE